MGNYNRHLRGDTNEILVPVAGKVVVEAGDLMWLDPDSFKAEPISGCTSILVATGRWGLLYNAFLGIAMEASPSGVTENISVATTGVFRYPLTATSAVTIDSKVSAVSTTGVATDLISNQTVVNHATQTGAGTTAYLGYIVKTQSACTFVDFKLSTFLGDGKAT